MYVSNFWLLNFWGGSLCWQFLNEKDRMPTSTLLPVHYSPFEDTCSRFSFLFIHSLFANRKEPRMLKPRALIFLFKFLFLCMNIHSHFRSTNSLTICTLAVFAQMRIQTVEWWLWRDIMFNEPSCFEIVKTHTIIRTFS